ncbi:MULTISPECIES: hypothetical protein [Corallococcus]|uniref:hypothetical protein n=1 Tax=Corallococcus TaxID=83461 RepID=UPI00131572A3|nr:MULTISPECIES: hypothetical protein [Corallococcus]
MKTGGVTSEFPRATEWSMKAAIGDLGATDQGFTLAARDGEDVVSTIRTERSTRS